MDNRNYNTEEERLRETFSKLVWLAPIFLLVIIGCMAGLVFYLQDLPVVLADIICNITSACY